VVNIEHHKKGGVMTVVRRLQVTGLVAGTLAAGALVTSAPAAAILPPADGVYSYVQDGAPVVNWKIQTLCMQVNGTRAQGDYTDETIQSESCTAIVQSSTPVAPMTTDERNFVYAGRAKLTSGQWTFQISFPGGLQCPDGSTAPTTETFAFNPPDPNSPNPSVTGLRTSIHGAECGLQPGMVKIPFALNYTKPLDPPVVDRYPDVCNYLGGRPSICS